MDKETKKALEEIKGNLKYFECRLDGLRFLFEHLRNVLKDKKYISTEDYMLLEEMARKKLEKKYGKYAKPCL